MFCGSCLHDNTLAKALSQLGVDAQLIPTYTPIRTDEEDVSIDRVFFGGINVYLQQKIPLFRHLPAFLDRFLDQPWLIRLATSRGMETSAKELGALTVSMLRGDHGYQRKEVQRLTRFLQTSVKPDLVITSNMLIAGCVPALKRALGVPVVVTLQGDDIFLDELVEPYRQQAFAQIHELIQDVDAFLVYSDFYAGFMSDYLQIPRDKFRLVPLGLELSDYVASKPPEDHGTSSERPVTIGYLARLAEEKGLHLLVDAFIHLRKEMNMDVRLQIAGWLGPQQESYAETQFAKLREAGFADAFRYVGEVDREGKLQFLQEIDVLSVPTIYKDPKGLFVLEALAAGVPVVQPRHGAFPELLDRTGGGKLVEANDVMALAEGLAEIVGQGAQRRELGITGQQVVHEQFHSRAMAEQTLDVLRTFV